VEAEHRGSPTKHALRPPCRPAVRECHVDALVVAHDLQLKKSAPTESHNAQERTLSTANAFMNSRTSSSLTAPKNSTFNFK
jgi:hypothetical protein